jgi:hypothetical protein
MRVKDVQTSVRKLGLTCSWNSDFKEFRVDYKRDDPRWTSESSYHTNDSDDAVGTAKLMAVR